MFHCNIPNMNVAPLIWKPSGGLKIEKVAELKNSIGPNTIHIEKRSKLRAECIKRKVLSMQIKSDYEMKIFNGTDRFPINLFILIHSKCIHTFSIEKKKYSPCFSNYC